MNKIYNNIKQIWFFHSKNNKTRDRKSLYYKDSEVDASIGNSNYKTKATTFKKWRKHNGWDIMAIKDIVLIKIKTSVAEYKI